MSQRFGTDAFVLLYQQRPGERETRFRPAADRSMKRPKGDNHHV